MEMKRGDLVRVSLPGAYGKPRPALIIQSNLFKEHPSVTILPITSELRETPLFRITIEPNKENGLRKRSQVMIDKAHTVPREKLNDPFGILDDASMLAINRALTLFFGFA
jgi:mRNA interferase MazF